MVKVKKIYFESAKFVKKRWFFICESGKNLFMKDLICQILEVEKNISIIEKLEKVKNQKRNVVFLCVGNSSVWFDSFGPIVGSFLQTRGVDNFVYGNVRSNILMKNICEYVDMIHKFHVNPYIIVVDSSVSDVSSFELLVKEESTICGAFSENPCQIGDLKIACLVPSKDVFSDKNKNRFASQIKKICLFLNFVFC